MYHHGGEGGQRQPPTATTRAAAPDMMVSVWARRAAQSYSYSAQPPLLPLMRLNAMRRRRRVEPSLSLSLSLPPCLSLSLPLSVSLSLSLSLPSLSPSSPSLLTSPERRGAVLASPAARALPDHDTSSTTDVPQLGSRQWRRGHKNERNFKS